MRARHHVRGLAQEAGLRLIDQTKIVTAVSELARNTVIHGGGGHMSAGITHGVNNKGSQRLVILMGLTPWPGP